MSMHTLTVPRNQVGCIDVYTNAVPPIQAGAALYIQNITSNTATISESTDDTHALHITKEGTATSALTTSAGDAVFIGGLEGSRVVLRIQADV